MANTHKKTFSPKIDPEYIPNAPKEVLEQSISTLKIYPDTQAKLETVGLNTVFDIARLEMKYLYRIENMTKKDVFAVMRGLHALGLDFKRSEKVASENNATPQQRQQPQKQSGGANALADSNNVKHEARNSKGNRNGATTTPDGTLHERQKTATSTAPREKFNSREDFNDNGTIKPQRERINSRDFDTSGKNKNNSPSDFRSNKNTNSNKKLPAKMPIKLPPLVIEDGLYKFFKSGKWGYKDDKGMVVIQPQFDEAYNFSEGMAGIEMGERVGFINKEGTVVIEPTFDTVCSYTEGYASVTIGEISWYIDKEGNKAFDGMEFESATPFINGSALVKKDGKWNFLSRDTGELRPR